MSAPMPIARRNVAWRIEQQLRAQEAMPAPTLCGALSGTGRYRFMPRLSWSNFINQHRASHLVIASIPVESNEVGTTLARNLQNQLRHLIDRLAVSGAHALTIIRSEGQAATHATIAAMRERAKERPILN